MPASGNRVLTALWTSSPAEARRQVEAALAAHETIEGAARALGVTRSTLYLWMAQHAIARPTRS